jgi:hypothetical protein
MLHMQNWVTPNIVALNVGRSKPTLHKHWVFSFAVYKNAHNFMNNTGQGLMDEGKDITEIMKKI